MQDFYSKINTRRTLTTAKKRALLAIKYRNVIDENIN